VSGQMSTVMDSKQWVWYNSTGKPANAGIAAPVQRLLQELQELQELGVSKPLRVRDELGQC